MSDDFKNKIDKMNKELFIDIIEDPKYLPIRPFIVHQVLEQHAHNKYNNFMSKSLISLVQIVLGVDIGLLLRADKAINSPEYIGLIISIFILILFRTYAFESR